MGSEGPAPAVTVHVTGFKKFHGVAENPTETIVNNLQAYMNKRGLPKGLILGSCTILETAGHGALVPLYQTLQSAVTKDANSGRVVWVIKVNHLMKKMLEANSSDKNLRFSSREYEAACKLDPDLQSFDTSLQARTRNVISSLQQASAGLEVRAVSLESLREITECLLEMNQEVVKVILECKKDIWRNQELFQLVEDYFDNSLNTLDFCASLEKCLKRIRDQQLLILMALQQLDDAQGQDKYSKALEELKSFKDARDPDFFKVFQSVYRQQMLMLEKLHMKKNKLDKKLKYIHAWRKVSTIIFAATFATVLICSVVAATMAAPPVAAALAVATSIPLGSMGKWIDSVMNKFENAMKGQREMINSMSVGTYITIKDMDNIRVLIGRLEVEMEALMRNAEVAAMGEGEEAVKMVIDEIKKNLDVFMKNVEELGVEAEKCSRDTRRARTVILQRIINPLLMT